MVTPANPSSSNPLLDRLIDALVECLSPESADRLFKLKADKEVQARVDELAAKSGTGSLSADERAEYETLVSFSTFIAVLKSKARMRRAQCAPSGVSETDVNQDQAADQAWSHPGDSAYDDYDAHRQSSAAGQLPDWCNVYEGLSDEAIEQAQHVARKRADLTRPS